MRRHATGIIALFLLASSAGLFFWHRVHPDADWCYGLMGATVRVGVLMAAVWLAYEELRRLPAWVWATLPPLMVILALRPKYLLLAVPIVIVLVILKPRVTRRP